MKKYITVTFDKRKLGHPQSEDTRKKISTSHFGIKQTESSKQKIRIAHLGKHYGGVKKGTKPWNKGVPMSSESKIKLSNSLQGRDVWNKGKVGYKAKEAHWNWKPNRDEVILNDKKQSIEYRAWSHGVKRRDNYECKMKNEKCHGRLESHHILPWRDYIEERYNLNNGITLCSYHHPRKRVEEIRLISTLQGLVLKTT